MLTARRTVGARLMAAACLAGVLFVALVVSPRAVAQPPRVALLAAAATSSSDVRFTDPQNRLLATGLFSAVDILNISSPNPLPSLAQLSTYDAVMVWSNQNFTDSTGLGNLLADYTDSGGGVVLAVFATNTTSANRFITGRFESGGYSVIQPQGGSITANSTLGTIHQPAHPIMLGVSSLNSNTSSRPSTMTLLAHGVRVVDWADGRPLAAVSTLFPRRVDLGLYPPSSSVSAGFWDQATDGAVLMANALLYASTGGTGSTPPFGSGVAAPNPASAGGSTTLTVTVIPGTNPASTGVSVAANLSALGGAAMQTFAAAGGDTYTYTLNLPGGQASGSYTIPLTVTDAEARTGGGSIDLTVLPPLPPGFVLEVEPNDSKAQATPAIIASGQGVFGQTTGTSTTVAGVSSADYFLITTPPAAPGIYRHRMTLATSGAEGHTGSLRGLTQSSGTPNPGTDSSAQLSTATTVPPRFNQWYGFGRGEQIHYRVTGSASTTLEYRATLETTPVTPVVLSADLPAGPITISRGAGVTTSLDMLVYDANFNAVADFNNDGGNTMTRTFAPGTYYLGVSNFNTADTRGSTPDSATPNGTVLEFPHAVMNSSTTIVFDLSVNFSGGATSADAFLSKDGPFDVAWVRFAVGGGGCPADFNNDGSATLQDLFDFLNAWFVNDPTADVNGVGGVSLQDIFDYLGAYFAGC